MISKLRKLYRPILNQFRIQTKQIIYSGLIKLEFLPDFVINFLMYVFRVKFKINFTEKYIYDKFHVLYYSKKNRNIFLVNGIKDRFDILIKEYLLNQITFEKGDIVIDCGANIGEVSLALNKFYGVENFILIEPEKEEFEVLKKNFKEINASILNLALFNFKGELSFYQKNTYGDSSLFETKDSNKIIVPTETLENIFFNNKINECKLLKLEAEGAEPEILLGGLNILNKIKYISVDCGAERGIEELKTINEVSEILFENNFQIIDINGGRDVILFKNKLL